MCPGSNVIGRALTVLTEVRTSRTRDEGDGEVDEAPGDPVEGRRTSPTTGRPAERSCLGTASLGNGTDFSRGPDGQ